MSISKSTGNEPSRPSRSGHGAASVIPHINSQAHPEASQRASAGTPEAAQEERAEDNPDADDTKDSKNPAP